MPTGFAGNGHSSTTLTDNDVARNDVLTAADILTPKALDSESRPLRVEPPAFLLCHGFFYLLKGLERFR